MDTALLSEFEFLGLCFGLLAMLLGIVKYERSIRRWSLRHPRRRGKFRKPAWHRTVQR